ncbi:TusE/DsrC/DsvC family sulfur relay protein [Candidatus Pacearchaeota archaeon]|nr:TusE/DsrC/DsvC family sulfur relay protein [Candidatus Pacearchaeota archaeon]
MSIVVKGITLETDKDGYLTNINDWNEGVTYTLANEESIILRPEHWEVIHLLRDFYQEYKITPTVRVLTKMIGGELGEEKGNTKYLYELFPKGFAKHACKLAGLPKPTGCH